MIDRQLDPVHSYRAECDKSGMVAHFKATDDKDARDKLISNVVYWQAQKKYKTNIDDWKIEKESS